MRMENNMKRTQNFQNIKKNQMDVIYAKKSETSKIKEQKKKIADEILKAS